MSTTTVPHAGDFVIISQVRQSGKQNEPEPISGVPARMPKALAAFYRGEPEVLGTTQIFTGFLLISIGIALTVADSAILSLTVQSLSGISVWSAILFIISGSLSVAASVKPTVGKVTSSLVMNIFCSLAAACGIIIAGIDVGSRLFYIISWSGSYCAHYKKNIPCIGAFTPLPAYRGITSFFLMLFILMFCIAISLCVFACKTVCRTSFEETTVVIYQTTSLNVANPSRDLPPDSAAALTSDLNTQT
ncbi:membrane-spanning 4-domains subfamily A member 4A-like isoform 1-T1 [Leptodactylus fuscus]|uniref:membrane-spanning 4-domains subfamily A member 4A-like isoform X1 n=1 Tax=Leptodactylus fuscus TaxID=238119 RepID=UPI003F4EE8A5